jgi:hypothetical protein
MPSIIEDLRCRDFKQQAIGMVQDFQWMIRQMSLSIYFLPYWELPAQSKRAIRSAAREVIVDRIWELTEPK